MNITTMEQAIALLQNVVEALNQISVQGRNNCYIVVASTNDVNAVSKFLIEDQAKDRKSEMGGNTCA